MIFILRGTRLTERKLLNCKTVGSCLTSRKTFNQNTKAILNSVLIQPFDTNLLAPERPPGL